VGFWRVRRLFQERNLPLTVFGCALALERNPAVAAAIRESGWDVCSHGWRWVKHYELSEREERQHIRRAIDSMQKTVGERPLGWYCRYGPSVNTRELLVEEGGFLYDSDGAADDIPYYVESSTGPFLVVPYSKTHNDSRFLVSPGFSSPRDFLDTLTLGLGELLREEPEQATMMTVAVHARWSGQPARAAALRMFIEHALAQDGVAFLRRADIARWWLDRYPPSA
jgi:peptidoglycan/xylan/chitin deacetylase (PgdA/CDA1 family)